MNSTAKSTSRKEGNSSVLKPQQKNAEQPSKRRDERGHQNPQTPSKAKLVPSTLEPQDVSKDLMTPILEKLQKELDQLKEENLQFRDELNRLRDGASPVKLKETRSDIMNTEEEDKYNDVQNTLRTIKEEIAEGKEHVIKCADACSKLQDIVNNKMNQEEKKSAELQKNYDGWSENMTSQINTRLDEITSKQKCDFEAQEQRQSDKTCQFQKDFRDKFLPQLQEIRTKTDKLELKQKLDYDTQRLLDKQIAELSLKLPDSIGAARQDITEEYLKSNESLRAELCNTLSEKDNLLLSVQDQMKETETKIDRTCLEISTIQSRQNEVVEYIGREMTQIQENFKNFIDETSRKNVSSDEQIENIFRNAKSIDAIDGRFEELYSRKIKESLDKVKQNFQDEMLRGQYQLREVMKKHNSFYKDIATIKTNCRKYETALDETSAQLKEFAICGTRFTNFLNIELTGILNTHFDQSFAQNKHEMVSEPLSRMEAFFQEQLENLQRNTDEEMKRIQEQQDDINEKLKKNSIDASKQRKSIQYLNGALENLKDKELFILMKSYFQDSYDQKKKDLMNESHAKLQQTLNEHFNSFRLQLIDKKDEDIERIAQEVDRIKMIGLQHNTKLRDTDSKIDSLTKTMNSVSSKHAGNEIKMVQLEKSINSSKISNAKNIKKIQEKIDKFIMVDQERNIKQECEVIVGERIEELVAHCPEKISLAFANELLRHKFEIDGRDDKFKKIAQVGLSAIEETLNEIENKISNLEGQWKNLEIKANRSDAVTESITKSSISNLRAEMTEMGKNWDKDMNEKLNSTTKRLINSEVEKLTGNASKEIYRNLKTVIEDQNKILFSKCKEELDTFMNKFEISIFSRSKRYTEEGNMSEYVAATVAEPNQKCRLTDSKQVTNEEVQRQEAIQLYAINSDEVSNPNNFEENVEEEVSIKQGLNTIMTTKKYENDRAIMNDKLVSLIEENNNFTKKLDAIEISNVDIISKVEILKKHTDTIRSELQSSGEETFAIKEELSSLTKDLKTASIDTANKFILINAETTRINGIMLEEMNWIIGNFGLLRLKCGNLEDGLSKLGIEQKNNKEIICCLGNAITDTNSKLETTETRINSIEERLGDVTKVAQETNLKINADLIHIEEKVGSAATQLEGLSRKLEQKFAVLETKLQKEKSAVLFAFQHGHDLIQGSQLHEETGNASGNAKEKDKVEGEALSPPLGITSVDEIAKLPVAEIRKLLAEHSVDFHGIYEKVELVEKLSQLWKDLNTRRKQVTDEDRCKICLDQGIDCVFLECGHMATCNSCGRTVKDCPICRTYITRVVRTYRS